MKVNLCFVEQNCGGMLTIVSKFYSSPNDSKILTIVAKKIDRPFLLEADLRFEQNKSYQSDRPTLKK